MATAEQINDEIIRTIGSPSVSLLRNILRTFAGPNRRAETELVEFKREFNGSGRAWVELLHDIVCFANSSGGIIIFGVARDGRRMGLQQSIESDLDAARIQDQLGRYTLGASVPTTVTGFRSSSRSKPFVALAVMPRGMPFVFDKDGNFTETGQTRTGFRAGLLYVRRNGQNAIATQSDAERIIQRVADERSREFLARIQMVSGLPQGTRLVAVAGANPELGVELTGGETGSPVQVQFGAPGDAISVAEVLDAGTPYSSLERMLRRRFDIGSTRINNTGLAKEPSHYGISIVMSVTGAKMPLNLASARPCALADSLSGGRGP